VGILFSILFILLIGYFVINILIKIRKDDKLANARIVERNIISTEVARISSCFSSNTNFIQREENPDVLKVYAEKGILYIYFSSIFPKTFLNAPHIITKENNEDYFYTYSLEKLHRTVLGEVILKFKSRKKVPFIKYSLSISNMSEEDFNFLKENIL